MMKCFELVSLYFLFSLPLTSFFLPHWHDGTCCISLESTSMQRCYYQRHIRKSINSNLSERKDVFILFPCVYYFIIFSYVSASSLSLAHLRFSSILPCLLSTSVIRTESGFWSKVLFKLGRKPHYDEPNGEQCHNRPRPRKEVFTLTWNGKGSCW